jgi:hypothetical protein
MRLNSRHTRRRYLWRVIIIISVLSQQTAIEAQVIGHWNFNNTTVGSTGLFNTVSVANFSPSIPTKAFNAGTEYYGHNGWPTGAIDTNCYLEFSLSPNAGYALNILSLILRMRHSNTGPSGGSGPTRFSVRSSIDGFTADIATGTLTGAYSTHTVSPGFSFSMLPTAVSIRVYGYMAVLYSGGNNRLVFDNIEVTALGVILPAQPVVLTAKSAPGKVLVEYSLENTSIGTNYSLERSADGYNFSVISYTVETVTNGPFTYKYTDIALPLESSELYYRLSVEEPNGKRLLSPMVSVKAVPARKRLLASHAHNVLHVSGIFPANAMLYIFNSSGICVYRQKLNGLETTQTIECSLSYLSKGLFHIAVISPAEKQTCSVFVR